MLNIRLFRLSALSILLASPTVPGVAQEIAQEAQPQLTGPAAAQPPLTAPPVAPVTVQWSRRAAQELLNYIGRVGEEGLEPQVYAPDTLREAIASGNEAAMSEAASRSFLRLTTDLSGGHVRGDNRVDWKMPGVELNGGAQNELMASVASAGAVTAALNGLLPTHPQYAGLKRALANTGESDGATRDLIRTNLERWRWMPRNLGARHVLVNVPAFTAAIVDNGRVIARHRTVVGSRRTPTPQLMARLQAITFNPWWHVPQSIIPELGRMRGYEVRRLENGTLSVRQPPGPGNSLGRVKLEMPNNYAIYLHDTPAQSLFSRPARAFSHGCIRTQNIRDFAATLLAPTGQWDRAAIDQAIETGRTKQAPMAEPIPVYIAYFTAAATDDGEIVRYNDVYGRDAPVTTALNRAGGTAMASASR